MGIREEERTGRDRSADVDAYGNATCGATTHQGGKPCRFRAGWGTNHVGIGNCRLHGGSTPTHVKAAQRVQAAQAVATLGLPREVDPAMALVEEVYRSAGAVAWLSVRVAQLPDDGTAIATSDWTALYAAERDRLVRVARAAVDAGVAERTVRLAERQGALLEQVIRGVLAELGITGADAVVVRHLRAVTDRPALDA